MVGPSYNDWVRVSTEREGVCRQVCVWGEVDKYEINADEYVSISKQEDYVCGETELPSVY